MTPAWRLFAESWPFAWPRARVKAVLGEPELGALERVGILRGTPVAAGDRYPCTGQAELGCAMHLVEDEGSLLAVCELSPAQCRDEVVPQEDAVRCLADPETLGRVLQRAVRVPPRPLDRGRHVLELGDRRVGTVEARFVFVARPAEWLAEGGLDRLVDEDPDRVLVVLVLERRSVPASAPRRRRSSRVAWVALDEAFDVVTGTVDLADLWLSVAPGADLSGEMWPRYVFTADPDRARFTYGGRPLPVDRSPMVARLLVEVLRAGGGWVTRSFLIGTLWPDHGREAKPPTPDQLDRRLRQLKADLSASFTELPPLAGVAHDPIENLRHTDAAGGYRIAVPCDRVLWLSKP